MSLHHIEEADQLSGRGHAARPVEAGIVDKKRDVAANRGENLAGRWRVVLRDVGVDLLEV